MDAEEVARLRVVAAVLAAVVAAIHLLHPSQGGVALLVFARVGYLGDPRPLLFTLGGFALVFGIIAGYQGLDRRPLYAGGIVVTLSFLVGFALWHTALDHGGFWPYLEANEHPDRNALLVALDHLRADGLLLASKIAELGLLAALVVLYRVDR
ncbi:hypothetical protein [Natronomonas marina]|jgi:hypothetical protein|uniref:hypothetical protein n=1 Tax=Natronomonas marina TaxID=2961939 RepID=UPI0020C967CB|nr:hypothetical protein [Natronomonas marina]